MFARLIAERYILLVVLCAVGLVLTVPTNGTEHHLKGSSTNIYVEDFDEAWTFIRDVYAYFETDLDWVKARDLLRPRAAQVNDRDAFIALLEELIEHLCDHHAHLGVNTPSSPRLIPSGTDLWAEHREDSAYITDVRRDSNAEHVGLRPNMRVLAINGQSAHEAITDRVPVAHASDNLVARDWALRTLLAGRHHASVHLEVSDGEEQRIVEFNPGVWDRPDEPLTARILDSKIGYVQIHNSLDSSATANAWDAALVELKDTKGLILDLRDTPGGGNTRVARALLGRLISAELPYQRHELPSSGNSEKARRSWVEHVSPLGAVPYKKPVAVLVGRWTASMGEGVAIGLDAMQRGTVFGSAMAGLRGATYSRSLMHTKISVQIPAERLYHVDGTPREAFIPKIVDAPTVAGRDATIEAAKTWLSEL